MIITKKYFRVFNYGSLILASILILLIITRIAPEESFIYFIIVIILIFVSRIFIRTLNIKKIENK